jgi:NSS family neurotransmitter:Na+ symporter
MDLVSAKVMLPLGGLFISLFVGWYLDQKMVAAQITNEGTIRLGIGFLKVYIFLLRYIAPLAILAVFIYGLVG